VSGPAYGGAFLSLEAPPTSLIFAPLFKWRDF